MRVSNRKLNASPENILYELMLYTEWNQESDSVRLSNKLNEKCVSPGYRLWRPWDYLKKSDSLLDEVTNVQNSLLGWHFAVGEVGTILAILQETLLEIRTPRDDFSSVVGKATVPRDCHQQWRRMCWSPDSSILALASSNGAINFYDILGSNLFNIPAVGNGKESQVFLPQHSLAGMFFTMARGKNQKWPFELIVVDYEGNLRSYYISPSEGFMEFHTFTLNKAGVSSVCWDTAHNLIIVASPTDHKHVDLKSEHVGWGLSAWRLLNDTPYYRMAVPSPEDLAQLEARKGLVSWFTSFYSSFPFSVVFKMAMSPDRQHLACVHTCGTVSIWLLPSLRLHGVWSLKEQPNFDIQVENLKKKNTRGLQLDDFAPVDISWWADQKVMIARRNGAVSVCELSELRNLLGETPEFVHGEPKLSPVSTHKGVLVLECETNQSQDGSSSSDEEESLVHKSTALVQSTVYLLTDMERFQPKRKKAKIQKRIYRLLGIKSTTPDELFSRKIDAGEFEEALHLAEVYNLDCDRVYQSQWRNSPISEETISAFLSKISKKRWVFEECHERIPDTLQAAKKLIEFGLKITSLSALSELSPSNHSGIIDDNSGEELWDEKYCFSIPLDQLSDDQKCLIVTRKTLLHFSDKLFTYEKMIDSSEEAYDRDVYDKFRRQPVSLSAIDLARQSDHRAVALLLTYQGHGSLPYWLTILSNFPESTSPALYKDLLPECSYDGDVFPWEQIEIRSEDWCENHHFDELEPFEDLSEYQLCKEDETLTSGVLEEWYRNRIYEIELLSNMVDQPLELVKLARERNVKGLDGLYNELVTLEVLVYDIGMEEIGLRDLEIMTPIQKAQALMNQSTEENFVENMRHRLIPFMQRCEKFQSISRKDLLSQYITEISKNDLKFTIKMLKYCVTEPHNLLVQSPEELITLALEAVYAYPGVDQLSNTEAILRILPVNQLSDAELQDRVQAAQNELMVATILKARGHPLSPLYIHNHCNDLNTVRTLFADLANALGARVPASTEDGWTQLLQDLLQMQASVFTCLPLDLCYEVHTVGVLGSGSVPVVRTAVRSLCCHSEEQDRKPLSLQRSVELVLNAATQYFDSAASLADPNINLAKACLNLITEDNKEIQEEKDLIAALQLLCDFKINLLPMQVRLCTERLKLVESCLMSRPTAYKDYYKLLSLANKLRICGSDSRQREGLILLRVANISFEAGDYQFCAEMCQLLIDRRHSVGWQIAQRLGQCGQFYDLDMRQRLIAFAIIHCPDDKILELLDTRCELEHKRIQTLIKEQTSNAETPSDDEEFIDAFTSPQSPTKEFLPQQLISSTIQNTSKLLTHLTNTGFWKERFLKKDSVKDKMEKGDHRMREQGFPEYYSSVHNDRSFHVSALSADFSGKTVDWRQYQLVYALMRASLLEQEKLPQQLLRDIDNVLVQFATLVLPEDSCVGISALLSLSRPEASEVCFSNLPHSLLTLQLAVYVLALLPAVQHDPQAFLWSPEKVVEWAETHSDSLGKTSKLLTKALTQLRNFEQSKHVEQLNCGVDVRRFAWDHQYKTDSILGLAMCEEWSKLQAALELGSTHGVEAWEIVFSHIRNLLVTNSPLLAERLNDNRLIQTLRDQADDVVCRLQEVVLPTLNGINYNQLLNYYTVLQTIAPNKVVCGLLPRDHMKLIKKVKATSSDIDYVRLVSKPNEVLDVLKPALKKDTVNIVAKLLKELLKALPQLHDLITVGSLYAEWAVIQYKTECLNPNCRDRLEQFSALQTYFQKMNVSELLSFVKRAIFCHMSVIKLHVETRQAMIDMCLKTGSQHNLNEDPDVMKIQRLKEYIQDVWALENPSLKSLRNYIIRLDEACGDSEAISIIIQTALVDASVPSHVIQSMAKLSSKKSLHSFVTDLLHSLPPNQSMLTVVLQRVEDCLAQGEKADSWSILIGPISEKPELPAAIRKQAALISQRLGATYNEELEALRLKSEAVLRSPVQLAQVCDQNSRYLLFKQQLSQADSWSSLHTLSLLLSTWPDVDTSWYLELIETMSDFPSDETFQTLEKIFKKNSFEDEEIEHLVSRLDGNIMFTIMVCLIPNIRRLHSHAVKLLRNLPAETTLPKEITRRVVETKLTAELTGSPILASFRESLLDLGPEFCEQASKQLVSNRPKSDVLRED